MFRTASMAFLLVAVVLSGPVWAQTAVIAPTVDGYGSLETGGTWSINATGDSLVTQRISSVGMDRRALMEFALDEIPASATVQSVTLTADLIVFTYPPNPQVEFHGYAGNGSLEPSDPAQPFNSVGLSPVFDTLGVFDTQIDAGYVQSLVGTGAHLGLYGYAVFESQAGFASNELADIVPAVRPTLTVQYVPEPATLSLLALGGLLAVRRRRGAAR